MRGIPGRSGFTVLELLLSLAILSLILSVILPKFGSSLQRASLRQCLANRVVIQEADTRYFVDQSTVSTALNQLISAGYLMRVSSCTAGGVYAWIPLSDTNRVLVCSVHGSPVTSMASSALSYLFSSGFNAMTGLNPLIGGWSTQNGVLIPSADYGEHRISMGSASWTNYSVSLNALLTQGSGYGVYYRIDGNPNVTGYVFQYDPGLGNKFLVRKVVNGQEQSPFQVASMPTNFPIFNQSHQIDIRVQGDHQQISMDGQIVLDFHDSTFSQGMVGLRKWGSSNVTFDQIQVTSL